MLNRSLYLLRSSVGAVRSLRFSPCGRILAAAESIDFVRLFDVDADFSRCVPNAGSKGHPCESCPQTSCAALMRTLATAGAGSTADPKICHCKSWSPVCVYASCVGLLLRCKLDVRHAQEPGD